MIYFLFFRCVYEEHRLLFATMLCLNIQYETSGHFTEEELALLLQGMLRKWSLKRIHSGKDSRRQICENPNWFSLYLLPFTFCLVSILARHHSINHWNSSEILDFIFWQENPQLYRWSLNVCNFKFELFRANGEGVCLTIIITIIRFSSPPLYTGSKLVPWVNGWSILVAVLFNTNSATTTSYHDKKKGSMSFSCPTRIFTFVFLFVLARKLFHLISHEDWLIFYSQCHLLFLCTVCLFLFHHSSTLLITVLIRTQKQTHLLIF